MTAVAALLFLSCVERVEVRPPTAAPPAKDLHRYLIEGSNLPLFRDEESTVREKIAAWANAQGLNTVPLAQWSELSAQAARGEAPGGERCGDALDEYEAARRWQSVTKHDAVISTIVTCDKGQCRLHLTGQLPELEGEVLWSYVAPFNEQAELSAALHDALGRLQPGGFDEGGIVGGLGLQSSGAPVVVKRDTTVRLSAWPSSPAATGDAWHLDQVDAKDLFHGAETAVATCLQSSDDHGTARVQVTAEGRIDRCETIGRAPSCLCDVVQTAQWPAPARGQRLELDLDVTRPDLLTRDGFIVRGYLSPAVQPMKGTPEHPRFDRRVSDPLIEGWRLPPSRAALECLAPTLSAAVSNNRIGARITFDATGTAIAVGLTPRVTLEKSAQACLEKLLLTSRVPCPPAPNSWAEAELSVSLVEAQK